VVLGITIVHELVHTRYAFGRFELVRQVSDPASAGQCWQTSEQEPFSFGCEAKNELGCSWKHAAFGRRLDLYCAYNTLNNGNEPLTAGDCVALTSVKSDKDQRRPSLVRPRLISALLDQSCWREYEYWYGDKRGGQCLTHLGYDRVCGDRILAKMGTIVALRTFRRQILRYLPSANELAMKIVATELFEALGRYQVTRIKPFFDEIDHAAPPSALSEHQAVKVRNSSSPVESSPTTPSLPESEADATTIAKEELPTTVNPVVGWQEFAEINKTVALASGYLKR
jgi:hypothetical protein